MHIEWFDIKDPHPAALVNIQRAIDHMVSVGATNKFAPISIYAITKALSKQQKQVTQLIRDRPGFVQVLHNGKSRGYYYDAKNFGMKYPAIYGVLRTRTDLLAVEDVETSYKQDRGETVQEFNERMPEMAKQFRQETLKPDFELPLFDGQEAKTRTINFSYLPVEIAKDMVQVAAKQIAAEGLSTATATDIVTGLLSLLENTKENSV